MRSMISALIALAITLPATLAASGAQAAPTCLTRTGDAARCGTPAAMPVGWTLPPEQAWRRQMSEASGPTPAQQWGLVAVIGGLFALIALMPKFDGSHPGDWDRQEGDEEEE
jgi:hypothetical protein